jgi:hypothetical protein
MFRKKEVSSAPALPGLKDKAAGAISLLLLRVQRGFASFLHQRVNPLSAGRKTIFLFAFCAVFGGFSLAALVNVFRPLRDTSRAIRPAAVSVPKYGTGELQQEVIITGKDMERIAQFKAYMDSLRGSASGRRTYDTILTARPGLLDSIHQIEQFYSSPLK